MTWRQDADELSLISGKRRLSGRIHIIGLGNVGLFVAHSLASRPSPPPVTLMLHNPGLYKTWLKRKKCLSLGSNGLDDVKTGFDIDVLGDKSWISIPYWKEDGTPNESIEGEEDNVEGTLAQSAGVDDPIECLIVAAKAPVTRKALESVRHRLTPDSTVLFLQNGMGVIDEINKTVFTEPHTRPHYVQGIVSHGLARRSPNRFSVTHTGVGTTVLGVVPPAGTVPHDKEADADWAPSTKYLLRILTLTPPLVAIAETPSALLLYQLEKVAMNSVINPLTAVMNCENGELLYNYSYTRIMRLLLMEISGVICALPELQGIPGIETRFSPERLRWMVTQLANRTAHNHSSMLQDVRNGKTTEIEYMNGYIVRRGEELGVKCVVNYMMKHLVLAKKESTTKREWGAVPVVDAT
ncbi:2-dehydropantoate 2-reductase (Ketopantoate reductase) (KPA reductase) (KPR) [Aspergillus melleus]|uniref:2-dehydropantoate 2-reductase (Ketopantoate reductase) (KPA reductase) (KPR) n=1 Tax=Aspergillus melleus TaxID=138277 RepID=A0ACC3AUS3_9EURO|nr:2-dehydropantoate 2-reductase (Ketopantoate reductase) (KPA reductase) (KPR) [Aspergillus melleus]